MSKKKLTYEEAIIKLENIIRDLENEDSSLAESMEKFKEGIDLYNYCNDLITKAEGEVKVILKEDNGQIEEAEFLMEV